MGCICGKPLVKSSIEKVKEPKPGPEERENSVPPLQETSNESDRILISQQQSQKPIRKSKIYDFLHKPSNPITLFALSSSSLQQSPNHSLSQWSKLIQSHKESLQISLKPIKSSNASIKTDWDRSFLINLSQKILNMPARDWVSEQIKNLKSKKSEKPKIVQLKYQFQWFLWAVRNVWLVFIHGKQEKVTTEFENLSGKQLDLPESPEAWFEGFEYKNTRLWLAYRGSEIEKKWKSEIKAMKNLYLDSFNSDINLVLPSIQSVTVGPFTLFGMPLYPDSLFEPTESLQIPLMSNSEFMIPSSNLFKLSLNESVYLVHSCSALVPPESQKSLIVVFNSLNQSKTVINNFYEQSIPKKELVQILYPDKVPKKVGIRQHFLSIFGWDCCVFWDCKTDIQAKHEFSGYFGDPVGHFLVFFFEGSVKSRRQVDVDLNMKENLIMMKIRIKDCVNTLEQKESINTQEALNELIHRKGLRAYHQWIIYSKCRSIRTSSLLEASLLARAVKRCVFTENLSKNWTKVKNFKKILAKTINNLLVRDLEYNETQKKTSFFLFIDRLYCLNEVLKLQNKSDTSSSRIIDPIPIKIHSMDFLKTSEIIEKILKIPSNRPKIFLRSLETQLSLQFAPQILIKSCNDPFSFLSDSTKITSSQIFLTPYKQASITSLREEAYLILLRLMQESNNSEDCFSSANDSQILIFHKESELSALELILPCDLYSKNPLFFSDYYYIPSFLVLQEWLKVYQSIFKGIVTPSGEDSTLIEILEICIFSQICHDKKSLIVKELARQSAELIDSALFVPADLVISHYMALGIYLENFDVPAAEQNYLTALLLMTRVYGDPRGRKNLGIPWQMTASWKLSKIAREEKRIHDAQLAEEHFDSVYMNSSGFQHNSQKKYTRSSIKQQASIYTNPFDETKEPLWEDLFTWILNNTLIMYSSKTNWNKAEIKEFIKLTQISQFPSQLINTSGASTPSSYKNSKRVSYSSLSQTLIMQEFSLSLESSKGIVYIWGSDTDGQLGIANEQEPCLVLMYPRMLTTLKDFVISEIAAGALHCVAVTVDGLCFTWGNNESGQLGLGPDMPKIVSVPMLVKAVNCVKSAACGYQHTIFLNYSGNILTAGLGEGGILGHSNTYSCPYPKTILSMNKIQFTSIKSGGYHSLALSSSGQVFVWGRGEGGQLGLDQEELIKNGQDIYIDCPTRILNSLQDKKIVQIACGEAHNLALTSLGQVYAWGWGSNGQLGNGYKEEDFEESGNSLSIQYYPIPIQTFTCPIIKIAAGGLFSVFINAEHEIFICGANDKKQLGLEMQSKDVAIPVKIECFTGYPIENVACGESHCLAIASKLVWTWGNHLDHRLGLGDVSGYALPRLLQTLTNAEIFQVSCGRMHSMALVGKVNEFKSLSDGKFLDWKIEF